MNDEEDVSRMLASLKAVDAPQDFEGGVRSRIAERREAPALWRPSFMLVAKFAFPLLLLIAVGGYLLVSDDRELSRDMVPAIGDGTHEIAAIEDTEMGPPGIANTSKGNSPIARVPVNRGGENTRSVPSGGSQDIGLSPDNSTVFPQGVDPRKANITNGMRPIGGPIAPESVLLMIGIFSTCSSTGCVANSVRGGSIAANAGIQGGDVISAVDGRPITAGGITGQVSVGEITIVRSGRIMNVPIGRP
jgi:membrane-associated protease RseP (regulator of RpoE activity)